jgi:hypothetical protein
MGPEVWVDHTGGAESLCCEGCSLCIEKALTKLSQGIYRQVVDLVERWFCYVHGFGTPCLEQAGL